MSDAAETGEPEHRHSGEEKRRLGFRTLQNEARDRELEVEGSIPGWVEGSLYRNGPAKFEAGSQELNHWFDGYAMLHLFDIREGGVRYSNRFLRSEAYRSTEGGMTYGEFATDPCRDLFKRFFTFFKPPSFTDNANVNVARIADHYVAMTETPLPVRFDPETLETLGVEEYDVDGQLTTAHPHYDPWRKATLNYVTKFSLRNKYRVFEVPDDTGVQELLAGVGVDKPSYMHSFGMTRNYVVLVEFPLVVNPWKIVLGNRPFIESYEWRPERGTRFTVIEKDGGDVVARPHTHEAFFAFHHVNAYEDGDRLVVDIAAYPDASIVEDLYLDSLRDQEFGPTEARLRRFHVKLSGEIESETIADTAIELPRINYGRCNAQPYRYAYGAGRRGDGFLDQLVKIDVEERDTAAWWEEDTYPGEPVFVEAPDPEGEDDGVVLSVVLDAAREASFLLVLDASSFTEVARARMPHAVPNGFHGFFERTND